jgi:hypothetical protein
MERLILSGQDRELDRREARAWEVSGVTTEGLLALAAAMAVSNG